MNNIRVVFAISLFLAVIFAPLSVTLFLMVVGLLWFSRHFESVAIALMIEFLYHGEGRDMFGSPFPFAALTLLVLFVIEELRVFIRVHRA